MIYRSRELYVEWPTESSSFGLDKASFQKSQLLLDPFQRQTRRIRSQLALFVQRSADWDRYYSFNYTLDDRHSLFCLCCPYYVFEKRNKCNSRVLTPNYRTMSKIFWSLSCLIAIAHLPTPGPRVGAAAAAEWSITMIRESISSWFFSSSSYTFTTRFSGGLVHHTNYRYTLTLTDDDHRWELLSFVPPNPAECYYTAY